MVDSCEDDLSEVKDETEVGERRPGEVEDTDLTLELDSCVTDSASKRRLIVNHE